VVFGGQNGWLANPMTYLWSLSGTDADLFEIDSDKQLKFKSAIKADYETKSSYNVTVSATDTEGLSYSDDFTLSVTDVEETPYGSTAGNDDLEGFSGFGVIDGGEGIDAIEYSISRTAVDFSQNEADQLVIQNTANSSESEALVSMERIQFSDQKYALDLDGNAGVAAKAIITSFGAESLNTLMSPALSIVDEGLTLTQLCDLIVQNSYIENLIGSSTNGSFVDHVYKNVVGVAPSQASHDTYTALLDNGTYTKSSLLALAANTTLAEDILTANTIDLIGVPGSADGEILALQYDIGLT
jgi:hypothetical protein